MKANIRRACRQVGHNWGLYLLLLPSFLLLLIFSYKPMYGVILAFKDYKNSLGITGSPWADPLLKYFTRFFKSFQFGATIRNTLALNLYSLLVGFPIPIFLALMINQITARRFRKGFQTVLYLPHFISTVVMVGLLLIWLSPSRGLLGAWRDRQCAAVFAMTRKVDGRHMHIAFKRFPYALHHLRRAAPAVQKQHAALPASALVYVHLCATKLKLHDPAPVP